jgi:hypothetical protein
MTVWDKLEAMLESRKIYAASVGRTTVPGPTRFASIEASDRAIFRAQGNSVEEAMTKAVDHMERRHKVTARVDAALAEKGHAPSHTIVTRDDGDDPLSDLLG